MSDNINLVEAMAFMVEHHDINARQLGMPTIKAFVNADAIKILFDTSDDTTTLEAYYKEELTGSFTVGIYCLTDYLNTIFQNVQSQHEPFTLEEAMEECLSDYGKDSYMDWIVIDDQIFSIQVEDASKLTFEFKDENTWERASVVVFTNDDGISRSLISELFDAI